MCHVATLLPKPVVANSVLTKSAPSLELLVLPDEVVVLAEQRAQLLDLLLPLPELLQEVAVALRQPHQLLVEIFYGVLHLGGVLWQRRATRQPRLHLRHVADCTESLPMKGNLKMIVQQDLGMASLFLGYFLLKKTDIYQMEIIVTTLKSFELHVHVCE